MRSPPASTPVQDRRVRRSRAALMRAAVTLVAERGTAAVPISDLAEAADVSRQVVYQQFGDRDTLLLEAALDLARHELAPHLTDVAQAPAGRARALAVARHFADHRVFYRALMTGSCGYALNRALTDLLIPLNRQVAHLLLGERLDPRTSEDLATFLTGGAAAVVNTWVVEGADPLDPEELTDRLMRAMSFVAATVRRPAHDEEHDR
ncbi:TetR family transcriptional regulator [Actinomadura craniellae]|uniref:TetR family transcriptional regulator n=1 Tax=Actinomadura craniellae TaxID=2231787 RepID=A0A365H9H5_9ACTN|nr:TetR/AcrR family transcriptional regulator [Actinomadura craniellae]RAY15731.1 TetR family transcriptional regulator [Actinomadura craniellae]